MTTFVSVGNGTQPFQRLIDAVLGLVHRLPQPVIVQHGNTAFSGNGCVARSFMNMEEFAKILEDAELLILHGGAGSIIHALQMGKVPVVMPRLSRHGEIVDDHQLEFARFLAESGRIVLVQEPRDLGEAVNEVVNRQKCARGCNAVSPMIDMVRKALQSHAVQLE